MGRKAKRKDSPHPDLTPLELILMQIVWEKGNAISLRITSPVSVSHPPRAELCLRCGR